jgi:hypothetical protein
VKFIWNSDGKTKILIGFIILVNEVINTLTVLLLVFTSNAIKLQHEGIDVTHASPVASHEELALLHESGDRGTILGN